MYKDENGNLIVDGEEVGETSDIVTVRKATAVITNNQIRTLPTTPEAILPNAPEGKFYNVLGGYTVINTLAGAYTNVESTNAGGITTMNVTGLFSPAFTTNGNINSALSAARLSVFQFIPAGKAYGAADADVTDGISAEGYIYSPLSRIKELAALSDILEQPVNIGIDNYTAEFAEPAGDLTGGHASNYIIACVYYTLEDFGL
jgi:hypothetical protein